MTSDPFELFDQWFAEAKASELNDPDAMTLATAGSDCQPSARMVLLKGHSPDGFVFYTNLGSRKGGELSANPQAALVFHWKSLRRQVRIEGPIEPVSEAEADAYHLTRTRDSQLSAWASEQSRPLDSRETLEARFAELAKRFEGQPVPRPEHWAGFRVRPLKIEFWIDGQHRLHHRRLFTLTGNAWTETLLNP